MKRNNESINSPKQNRSEALHRVFVPGGASQDAPVGNDTTLQNAVEVYFSGRQAVESALHWHQRSTNSHTLVRGPRWQHAPSLSQSISASSMECVVSTTALPRLASDIVLHSWRRAAGSSPVEGSSRYVTAGSPINDMATESLLFMPARRGLGSVSPGCKAGTSMILSAFCNASFTLHYVMDALGVAEVRPFGSRRLHWPF